MLNKSGSKEPASQGTTSVRCFLVFSSRLGSNCTVIMGTRHIACGAEHVYKKHIPRSNIAHMFFGKLNPRRVANEDLTASVAHLLVAGSNTRAPAFFFKAQNTA